MQPLIKTKKQIHLENSTNFLMNIEGIINANKRAKTVLTHALSGEPSHIVNTYPFVLPHLGKVDRWHQPYYILVAGLLAKYPQKVQPDKEIRQNFGTSYQQLFLIVQTQSTERKFSTLLNTDLVTINSPLANAVMHMKSKTVAIDYIQLLVDLLQWEHYDRYVQNDWARSFWNPRYESDLATENQINP